MNHSARERISSNTERQEASRRIYMMIAKKHDLAVISTRSNGPKKDLEDMEGYFDYCEKHVSER